MFDTSFSFNWKGSRLDKEFQCFVVLTSESIPPISTFNFLFPLKTLFLSTKGLFEIIRSVRAHCWYSSFPEPIPIRPLPFWNPLWNFTSWTQKLLLPHRVKSSNALQISDNNNSQSEYSTLSVALLLCTSGLAFPESLTQLPLPTPFYIHHLRPP